MQKIESVTTLGELIKTCRKQQGLTQVQLAAVSGVGLRFLRELEGGKVTCQIGKTMTVLKMLGISIMAMNRNEQIT
jgi:y4mF family transcriptional regulator